MKPCAWIVLATVILAAEAEVQAQFMNFGPGSTIQGDYLRGQGAAGFGEGYYNLATARAFAINTQTVMNWNDYVERVSEYQTAKWFRHMRAVYAKRQELWKGIQERLETNPEEFDVMQGTALNRVMDRMRRPNISQSAFRYAPVTLTVDMVRGIPFRLSEHNARISMGSLSIKGEKTWEMALRDKKFEADRVAYDKALKIAKAEQGEMKMSVASIQRLERILNNFQTKLDLEVGQGAPEYLPAKNQIVALQKGVKTLYDTRIERVYAELNNYVGSTVEDLKEFMRKHHLQFADAETPEERVLYPKLYEILKKQSEDVAQAEPPGGN